MSKSEIDAMTERRLERIEQALALRPELSRARMWQGKAMSWPRSWSSVRPNVDRQSVPWVAQKRY